ncbi:MAG: Gldg family protein [Candidatus Stahlbacteria bacterium]|nr:Gldg family protein [Candidatus Stahlbacteria bacterium]
MKNIRTIFLRELRGYFNSLTAYIVLCAWVALSGWFFVSGLFLSNQATIDSFFNFAPLFFLFFIPAISMRLLAEEERAGTSEILATMPIRDWEIITGKYLAALTLVVIGIGCTIIYPITIKFMGPIDFGVVVSSYIGLVLLAAGFASVGIFASSLTKSQVVAFIVSAVLCFIFFMLGKVLVVVPSTIVSVVQYLSVDYHLESLGRGVIDSRSVIYFLSMIAFFLSFAFYFYRRTKQRVLSGIAVSIVLGIIVILNFLSYSLFVRFDLTSGNVYSLSKASIKMVRKLEDPVIVSAYITDKLPFPYNVRSKYVKDILTEYRTKSHNKLKFDFIDPKDEKVKIEAQRAGIFPLQVTEVKEGEYGVKEGYMGLTILYNEKKEVIPVIEDINSLEYDITSRIKKLTSKEMKQIVFTKGHNEVEVDERLITKLREQYKIATINPDSELIPFDAASLVILGPKTAFSDTGVLRIKEAIAGNRTCAFFVDPIEVDFDRFFGTKVTTGLDNLLSMYGIRLKNGIVLDIQNQVVGITMQRGSFRMQNFVPYPFFPKVTDFSRDNSIVRGLESMVFPFVAAVEGGTPIAKSSKRSWIKKEYSSLNPMQQYLPTLDEEKGPFNLATYIDKPSRMIVVGSARVVEGRYASAANIAFFLNTIDWLAQDEDLIAIRSKGVSERPLRPTSVGKKRAVKVINTLLPSICLIVIGFVRWKRRAKRVYEI